LIYVGSAEDKQFDQELCSVLVGPVVVGWSRFLLEVKINYKQTRT